MKKPIFTLFIIVLITGSVAILSTLIYGQIADPEPPPPAEPYIIGHIYDLTEDRILVAEGLESPSKKYDGELDRLQGRAGYFTVTETTEILTSDDQPFKFKELTLNEPVAVWVTGPVMESYPVQGHTTKIRRLTED